MSHHLPIAILLPHASLRAPEELGARTVLSAAQVFNECDVYTEMIYDLRDDVARWECFDIARAFIDVNRATGLPADHPLASRSGDGAVKWQTSYGAPVFKPGQEPGAQLEQQLVDRYWRPWHETLASIASDPSVKLVLDCHSMAALGPSHYGDPGLPRPRACVANLGDAQGNPVAARGPVSAPAALAGRCAALFASAMADIQPLVPSPDLARINAPFVGGWDLYGHREAARQPWLMIEISRAMYVGPQDGDSAPTLPDMDRITALRSALLTIARALVA